MKISAYIITFNEKEKIIRIEIDKNGDKGADMIQHFDGNQKLTHIEHDTDQNRKTDRWDYYSDKKLIRVEFDTNSDLKPDQWQYFQGLNKIEKVESDTNFDGKADHWEFFDSSEKLIRKESDRNFDGKPDLVENQ